MAITLIIERDQATPVTQAMIAEVQSGRMENAMGRAGSNHVQAHLFKYNAEHPNKLGGRRTNFYAAAARGTNYQSKPGEIKISVNQVGIRQRLEGGTIRPVQRKFLTIPAVAEAHGRRATEFNNLVVRYGLGGRPVALVEAPASGIKIGGRRKDGSRTVQQTGTIGGRVMYWLVKEVNQAPDPSVLPSEDSIATVCAAAGERHLNLVKIRKEQSP